MTDYNLHGLNPRDFQHLVQAIARKQIASGVSSFGDGKDGARDLTFKGKMDYPSLVEPWDGYLVLGCKFCQRPTGDSKCQPPRLFSTPVANVIFQFSDQRVFL